MAPIRRRTFFGQLSEKRLKGLIVEARFSDTQIANRDTYGKEVDAELLGQNAKDREMRMAAQREIERREGRQQYAKEETGIKRKF